jgi:vacuolar-type H+-ATPase subunit I/STV1
MKLTINLHQHGGCVSGHAEIFSKLEQIMSAISDFAARVDAHNATIDVAVLGLTGDVSQLKQQITDLQNSAGTISAEDQALLDAIEARAASIAAALAALDALTPPSAP